MPCKIGTRRGGGRARLRRIILIDGRRQDNSPSIFARSLVWPVFTFHFSAPNNPPLYELHGKSAILAQGFRGETHSLSPEREFWGTEAKRLQSRAELASRSKGSLVSCFARPLLLRLGDSVSPTERPNEQQMGRPIMQRAFSSWGRVIGKSQASPPKSHLPIIPRSTF